MTSTLRADIYRLTHGIALYITFAIMIVLAMSEILTDAITGVTVTSGNANPPSRSTQPLNGATVAQALVADVTQIVFFSIPLFVAVAMAIFSCGAVKNSLAMGMSRTKLYFSALALSFGLCLLLLIVRLGVGTLTATIVNGTGDWTGTLVRTIFQDLGQQVVLLLAFTSIGVFLSFAIRNTAAVTGIYIAFAMLPLIVLTILSMSHPGLAKYLDYDLMTLVSSMGSTPGHAARTLALGIGYIIVTTLAGLAIFRRIEIK